MTSNPQVAGTKAEEQAATFQRFVEVDSESIDLIDHMAYALYEREKFAFLQSFRELHGRPPTEAELDTFAIGSLLDSRIDALRSKATEILREFSESVLSEAEKEVESRYREKFHEELKKARPFFRTLWDNILANIGALAITALVLVVIYGSKIGVAGLVGEVFNYDIKERATRPAAAEGLGPAPQK